MKQYLRFGSIPEDDRSSIYWRYDGGEPEKEEEGVSVYNFIKEGNKYRIVLPSFTEMAVDTLNLSSSPILVPHMNLDLYISLKVMRSVLELMVSR